MLFIVLEYADGGDLAAAIKRARSKGRFFSEPRVLFWFVQLASALRYCHEQRVLHRDLKASNIFLSGRDRVVKLGDFGISRVLSSEASLASTVIGTPYYLSPELIEGTAYSFKSDVWALGCVLYELCTLKHAFDAANMCQLVLKILRGKFAPPDGGRFSPPLVALIDDMLQLDPDARPSLADITRSDVVQASLRESIATADDLSRRSLEAARANVALLLSTRLLQYDGMHCFVSADDTRGTRISTIPKSVNGIAIDADLFRTQRAE